MQTQKHRTENRHFGKNTDKKGLIIKYINYNFKPYLKCHTERMSDLPMKR